MKKYSIKMRAQDENGNHISGAEKIVEKNDIGIITDRLIERALSHSKGSADFISVKVEKVDESQIEYLEALPVTSLTAKNPLEGWSLLNEYLVKLGIENGKEILSKLPETYGMRGAMVLDVDTLERLEADKERGIRATNMDSIRQGADISSSKNHYEEAVVLATKVANAPHIIAEICISDDPDYVTGYIASKEFGYVRISNLKEVGSPNGGRIFLYRGRHEGYGATLEYLEKQLVIVKNIPKLVSKKSGEKNKWAYYEKELKSLQEKSLYRTINKLGTAQTTSVTYNNKEMRMFASNSYLDLCNDQAVKEYVVQAVLQYGSGSGGSRLTTGTMELHHQLEQKLAEFKGTESALVFNTGYMANLGILSALCSEEDIIFSDELNHASIIDGCRLSKAKTVVYKHNDMADLEEKIKMNPCQKGVIISDGVFSMDGDIVNLPELVRIADVYGLLSMIDEAHATGVIGKTGRGTVEYYAMDKKPDILMGTLSKAIGSEGGFVCGNHTLIDYLKNKSRSFIYSTSLSPASIAASIKAVDIIRNEPQRVTKLQSNIHYFCQCLKANGINASSETGIIPIIVGDEKRAMELSKRLFQRGYYISAIRYPTVKKGSAMLRVTLMSNHTQEELKETADAIAEMMKSSN